MSKKIKYFNIISIFLILSLFLSSSVILIKLNNLNSNKEQLQQTAKIATEMYNGTNEEEVISKVSNSNKGLIIQFIDFNGIVLYSTSNNIEENIQLHIDEIVQLGISHKRFSNSDDKDMLFIARNVSSGYLRIVSPIRNIDNIVNSIIFYGIILILAITGLSLYISKKTESVLLKELNSSITNLADVVGYPKNYHEDIDLVIYHINEINKLIKLRIESVVKDKNKLDFILNNMNQSILVVDSKSKVSLINETALKLTEFKFDEVINKDFLFIVRDMGLQQRIRNCIERGILSNYKFQKDANTYSANISPIKTSIDVNSMGRHSSLIIIVDISNTEKLDRVKRKFFANASHELKSPLTNILGYQQMISEGIVTTSEEINDATLRTIKEAKRMDEIILGMLELSKLENQTEKRDLKDINLKSVVLDILDSFKNDINTKKINVLLKLDDLILEFQPGDLYQLAKNLIENAIKYNVDEGKLIITISKESKEFIVEDDGIGIPLPDQNRVFERFYRVDKARSKEMGGTGLGLSIVKHIAHLYRAEIKLVSKVNKGTIIKIKFWTN